MSRRLCSLADGVEQAPGKSMEGNEPTGFGVLDFTGFTSRRMPFPWAILCGRTVGRRMPRGELKQRGC